MRRLLLALAAAATLAVPASASAHANLVRTQPANGAVLARPPAAVRVIFDDDVRRGPGIAAVQNGGGSILAGSPRVEGGRTLVMPLRAGLVDGDYSVRWSIVSDDGHLESGVLAFAVGVGRPPPRSALAARATGPTADSVVARWLFFAGLLTAVGVSLFTLVARPSDEERVPILLSTACVLTAVGAADEVHRVGLGTRDGLALTAGLVAAIAAAAAAAAATLDRRVLRPALVLALGLAAVPAAAGHALDPGLPRLNVAADVLHVAGAAAWTGVLVGFVAVRGGSPRRVAALALGGVVLLGATGIVRASFELTAASQLWDTSYGRTLLVKTGLLLAALGTGWGLRARPRRRAAVELAVVAGLVVAVAVLVQFRPGRNVRVAQPAAAAAAEPSPNPPAPPPGAIVLAREAGPLGVAVAIEPARVTAIVLSPSGGGLSGLDVAVQGREAKPCGSGCYAADVASGSRVTVQIAGFGPTRRATFAVPARARPAAALVRRARRTYRGLRSVAYAERLASDPTHVVLAQWRLERPNRVSYAIARGAQGIVIGSRRWDRDSPRSRWQESAQTPLPQPATQWTSTANPHVLAQTAKTTTVSFADPTIPAYFTLTLDRRTLLPRLLHMTAPAHFMTDRYVGFNEPRAIRPPR